MVSIRGEGLSSDVASALEALTRVPGARTRFICEIFISFFLVIILFFVIVVSFSFGLASDECEDVRIDHVGIRGHHAVREARVPITRCRCFGEDAVQRA